MPGVERQYAHDAQGREYWYKNGQWEPVNEVSSAEAIGIGAGESMINLGRGLKQGINTVGEFFGDDASRRSNERLEALQAGDQEIMQGLREENPVSTMIGNALPAVATAPLAGTSILGGAALGASGGALSIGSLEERAKRALIGGAGGSVVPGAQKLMSMSQRVSSGIRNSAQEISGASRFGNMVTRGSNRLLRQEPSIGAEVQAQRLAGMPDEVPITGDAFDQTAAQFEREVFAPDSVGAARPAGTTIGDAAPRNSQERQLLEGLNKDAQGLTPGQADALATMQREGITLEPGMKTGNRGQRLLTASAKSNPLTANTFETMVTAPNRQVLNRKIGAALGEENLDEFTPSTIVNIEERLSDVRTDIMDRTPRLQTGDAAKNIKQISDEYLQSPRYGGVNDPVQVRLNKLSEIIEGSGDTIDTAQYQRLREDMRSLQRTATGTGDSTTADTLGDAVEELDKMFEANVSGADAAAWRATTQQFRLLNALERGKAIGDNGQIRLGSLSNNLKRVFKREFGKDNRFRGKEIEGTSRENKELFELVKALGKYQDLVGDSGTATRGSLSSILGDKTSAIAALGSRPLMRQWIKRSQ